VKNTGDGSIAVFVSPQDAVLCAAELQREISSHEAPQPPERQIHFRIGLHWEPIIFDDKDVYGGGVNIAVRLQGVAPAGGVIVSSALLEQISEPSGYQLDDLGELPLKNLMRIFGEIALLDGEPRTADATAVTKCQLLALDRRDFVRILAEEPAFAIKVLALVSRRLRQTTEQVEDLTFSSPRTRLAKALLRLADMQAAGNDGHARVAITQKELGRTIGLSRESTNKCLRDWENAGYIAVEKGTCTIKDRAFLINVIQASSHER
jgi:hypothetical protein